MLYLENTDALGRVFLTTDYTANGNQTSPLAYRALFWYVRKWLANIKLSPGIRKSLEYVTIPLEAANHHAEVDFAQKQTSPVFLCGTTTIAQSATQIMETLSMKGHTRL